MRFVGHRVEHEHYAGDFFDPTLGGGSLLQESVEDVDGAMASLVDGVPFGVAQGCEDLLNAKGGQQLRPCKLPPPV